jgi:membrane-associated phospholipid phosphatase
MNQGASMRFIIPLLVFPLLVGSAMATGGAQSPAARPDSTPGDTAAESVLPRNPELGRNTRAMLLGTVAVGGAISLVDSRLSMDVQRVGGDDMSIPSTIGSFVGGPVPLALGATLYAGGRLSGDGFVQQTGREVMRAVLISGGMTALVKGAVGRARPFAAPGDPDVFSPGRGFTNGSLGSFPSGHTSAAFATATVLARELNAAHPGGRWLTNTLLFGGATFVGFSRVYERQHWPSDVVAGAALGAITGYEVVAHARGDRSPIDRHLFSHVSVGPSWRGAAIQWALR